MRAAFGRCSTIFIRPFRRQNITTVPIRILHTNDMHGSLDERRFEKLLALRKSVDVYFDSGDVIKTGNLGLPMRPEAAWPMLDELSCSASVLGNRETHVLEAAFNAKLAGAKHPILCANLRRKDGTRPLPSSLVVEFEGIRMGVFGVMVPMVTERMASRVASAFLWDPPIAVADSLIEELRPRVDLLICLSHIGHRQDLELAAKCPSLDIVFGGHSHTVLPHPEKVGNTYVCQGGSHNRFAGVYEWSSAAGLTGGLVEL